MRGFVRVRRDDQKWSGGQSGAAPSLTHGGFVDFERAEMVLSESLAGGATGAESFARFLRGETAQIGMLESVLRNAGDVWPTADFRPDPESLAKSAVGCVVAELEVVQLGQNVPE